MPQISVQLPSLAMSIVPDSEDAADHLLSLGLLPGQIAGKAAVWEAVDTAQLAVKPAEFAAVAADAAVDPAGHATDAVPLYRAAAEAATQAGLVLSAQQDDAAAAVNGRGGYSSRSGVNAAATAVAHATDAVRQTHAQLMMTSGAAVALSSALAQLWQKHSEWRMSRTAHAAALSLQRCGVAFPSSSSSSKQQHQGLSSSLLDIGPGHLLASGPTVCGGWLPTDACGVPVGTCSTGRFPDASAFSSAAAAHSKLVTPVLGSSSSTRLPVCGWDLIRAVSGAAHPIAACLRERMSPGALADMPSLILEVSVSAPAGMMCACVTAPDSSALSTCVSEPCLQRICELRHLAAMDKPRLRLLGIRSTTCVMFSNASTSPAALALMNVSKIYIVVA